MKPKECEYCGNTSGLVNNLGGCISCGAPLPERAPDTAAVDEVMVTEQIEKTLRERHHRPHIHHMVTSTTPYSMWQSCQFTTVKNSD